MEYKVSDPDEIRRACAAATARDTVRIQGSGGNVQLYDCRGTVVVDGAVRKLFCGSARIGKLHCLSASIGTISAIGATIGGIKIGHLADDEIRILRRIRDEIELTMYIWHGAGKNWCQTNLGHCGTTSLAVPRHCQTIQRFGACTRYMLDGCSSLMRPICFIARRITLRSGSLDLAKIDLKKAAIARNSQ